MRRDFSFLGALYSTVILCAVGPGGSLSFGQTVADTKISIDSGFYTEPIEVTLTTATEDATILYTIDGSEPDLGSIFTGPNGTEYQEPITISNTTTLRVRAFAGKELEPTNTDTRTYFFLDDVIRQPADIEGWPRPNLSVGQGTGRHDYEMDPRIVGEGEQVEAMKRSLLALPTMSLVVDPESMWRADGSGGFYRGENEEFVDVEILYPDAPEENEHARGAIQGHSHDRLKRSLRLKFKTEFGDAKLETDLLQRSSHNDQDTPDQFDRLILRAGNNRSWARSWNPDKTAYTMDEWYRATQIAMSGYGARGAFVHLYINGLYWGLYNVTERPDRWFTSEHFGGGVEDWFAISHGGDQGGDKARWNALLNDAREDLSDAENFAALASKVDLAGFIDYLLVSWYINLTDWPQNNWWAGIRNEPAGKARFFAWDGEWSFGLGQSPGRAWVHPDFRRRSNSGNSPMTRLWHAARENADFMALVADRAYRHLLVSDGVLTDAVARERWAHLNALVREGVLAESARWGDALSPNKPRTVEEDWQNEVDRVDALLVGNGALLIEQLMEEDYYPDLEPPLIDQPSGFLAAGSMLSLTNPNRSSDVYYTLDGTDPRVSGGAVAASAAVYEEAIVVERSLHLKTRVLMKSIFGSETWSAMAERTFYAESPALRVSELMFHPSDPTDEEIAAGFTNDDDFEYLEVVNVGTETLSLTNSRFTDGIILTFAESIGLAPEERAVIVRNQAAFEMRYGAEVRVLGVYEQSLSNGGERLEWVGAFGEPILAFSYADAWHESADGGGDSLEVTDLRAEDGAWELASHWQTTPGGSPGQAAEPGGVDSPLKLSIQTLDEAHFQLTIMGRPNIEHVIESSADLAVWRETIRQMSDAQGRALLVVNRETSSTRYFRVREVVP